MPAPEPFFREVESWRGILNEAAGIRVPASELNKGITRLLIGLLFLRLVEPACLSQLMEGDEIYSRFLQRLQDWNLRRSGSILWLGSVSKIAFEDEPLRGILRRLCDPELTFDVEVLGQIHERQNPETRKAGGVFYTPSYIIDSIVARTLEPLFAERTPFDAEKAAILDPACGCGSFLLGACDWLFAWHLQWYLAHGVEAPLYKVGDEWNLTVEERGRIVTDHLFGVDVDSGAVGITRLSLLAKGMEIGGLGNNFKWGNSLLGPDFETSDLGAKARCFDWNTQFPAVMARGGFDALIGNPPYSNYSSRDSLRGFYGRSGQTVELEALNKAIEYCCTAYADCSQGCKDLYKWFTAKSLELTRPGGQFGFIIPNTWLTQPKYADLKRKIFEECGDVEIIDLGLGVFSVVVPTCIVIARKGEGGQRRYADLKAMKNKAMALESLSFQPLEEDGRVGEHPLVRRFLQEWPTELKLKNWLTLREGQHILRSDLVKGHAPDLFPVIDSKNMGRYEFTWNPRLSFTPQGNFRTTSGARLVVRKTGDAIVAALTPADEAFVLQSLYQGVFLNASLAPEYLLGLLNSKFLTFIYQNSSFGQKGRVLAQFRKGNLDDLPLPAFDADRHDLLVSLVKRRLGGEACEADIDGVVYRLYGLDEGEIALVEGAG